MISQQSLEGLQLQLDIEQRGYAELEHGIPGEAIEMLIHTYTDFTLAHPDPEPETMDAMLPETPDDISLFKLDALDRSKDTQATWHKYRTNVPGIGKPDGYTSRIFQDRALQQTRGISLGEDPKEFYHFTPVHRAAMARMHREYGWGIVPREVDKLDVAFGRVHNMATKLMMKVCGIVEETHPEIRQFITPGSLRTSSSFAFLPSFRL